MCKGYWLSYLSLTTASIFTGTYSVPGPILKDLYDLTSQIQNDFMRQILIYSHFAEEETADTELEQFIKQHTVIKGDSNPSSLHA